MLLEFAYKRINGKRARLNEDDIRGRYTEDQLELMGDRSPLFKYSY